MIKFLVIIYYQPDLGQCFDILLPSSPVSANSLVSSEPKTGVLNAFSLGLCPIKLRKKFTNFPFLFQTGICVSWKSCWLEEGDVDDVVDVVFMDVDPPEPD